MKAPKDMWNQIRDWWWQLTCRKCAWCGKPEPNGWEHTLCRRLLSNFVSKPRDCKEPR